MPLSKATSWSGGRVEHGAVADGAGYGALLRRCVELVGGDFLAVEGLGVDGLDGDRADDVVVAGDELADAGGLVEGPGDAVLGDGVLEGQVVEFGGRRGRCAWCRWWRAGAAHRRRGRAVATSTRRWERPGLHKGFAWSPLFAGFFEVK